MKNRLTRRQWLSRQLKSVAALFTLMAFRGIARGQDRDYFTGTDFVGKNRTGEFRNFYINYWKPHRRIEAQEWTLEVAGLQARGVRAAGMRPHLVLEIAVEKGTPRTLSPLEALQTLYDLRAQARRRLAIEG